MVKDHKEPHNVPGKVCDTSWTCFRTSAERGPDIEIPTLPSCDSKLSKVPALLAVWAGNSSPDLAVRDKPALGAFARSVGKTGITWATSPIIL